MKQDVKKNAAYYRRLLKKETDPVIRQKLQRYTDICEARKILGFKEDGT